MSEHTAHPSTATSDHPPHRYTADLANRLETLWQEEWDNRGMWKQPNPGEAGFDGSKPKQFVLDMFPYPSGVGLHVGHPLGYIATDIYARYLRMTGHNVLYTMGFDSFGLPAEQYAVQTNTHPRVTTERNIANMRRQLRRLGLSHDPRRSVSTTDESFYKWTQWIFLQIYNSWYDPEAERRDGGKGRARPIGELIEQFKSGTRPTRDGKPWSKMSEAEQHDLLSEHRLAYLAEVPVNWCPQLGTVLANEEVTADGRSERGNYPVYKRPLKQWMMRITAYADRLLSDLEQVRWPESVKILQRNWIGRSEGAYIDFECSTRRIRVFTTRPDTIYGATYMVLSPGHPMVDQILTEQYRDVKFKVASFPGAGELLASGASPKDLVEAYRVYAGERGEGEVADNEKTGVFTGAYAINPVNGARIPVFIADYVLMGYGTGAIMAVPGHDERDWAFAREFGLPVVSVVIPADETGRAHRRVVVLEGSRLPAPGPRHLAGLMQQYEPAGWKLDEATGDLTEFRFFKQADAQRFAVEVLKNEHQRIVEGDIDVFCVGGLFTGTGVALNSGVIDGLPTAEAKKKVTAHIESLGKGRGAVQYKLRDWLFSRQRYWGEPFPIVFDESGLAHAVPEAMLPVTLPPMDNFQPEASTDPDAPPRPPLARAKEWASCELDLGDGRGKRPFSRELNTMPNWAGSCWYYLRYLDAANDRALVGKEAERYWMVSASKSGGAHSGGVDLYVGGVEHAVLHLLYARFWHKALFDLGHVSTPEPFGRLFNQGYIQAAAYTDARGVYVEASEVTEGPEVQMPMGTLESSAGVRQPHVRSTKFYHNGQPVFQEFGKMGKSLKNAVAPDDVCAEYGCDTLRVYEMSMGPLEASKPWNTRDIAGSYRFLQRLWRNIIDEQTGAPRVTSGEAPAPVMRLLHKTILGVRRDYGALSFNTAVSKLIELNNELTRFAAEAGGLPRAVAEAVTLMLAPLAPHMAEELWRRLGHADGLAHAPFPVGDEKLAADDEVELPVQVQGKVRARVKVPAGADAKACEEAALAAPDLKPWIEGKTIKKVIVVPGKMVNVVV